MFEAFTAQRTKMLGQITQDHLLLGPFFIFFFFPITASTSGGFSRRKSAETVRIRLNSTSWAPTECKPLKQPLLHDALICKQSHFMSLDTVKVELLCVALPHCDCLIITLE